MYRRLLPLLFVFALSTLAKGQHVAFGWVKNLPGLLMCTDDSGNLYISGRTNLSFDFDPGPKVYDLTPLTSGSVYLAKYNASGGFLWAFMINDVGNSAVQTIGIEPSGNLVLAGNFSSQADLDPHPTKTYFLPALGNFSQVLIRFSPGGKFEQAKRIKMSFQSGIVKIDVKSGCVFLLGSYQKDLRIGTTIYFSTTLNALQVAFAKFDSVWNLVWVNGLVSKGNNTVHNFGFDSLNNFYCAGRLLDSTTFGIGADSVKYPLPQVTTSFIAKWDSTGKFSWMRRFTGTGTYSIMDFEVDRQGNSLICGQANGDLDFDPGPDTVKLQSSFSQFSSTIVSYDRDGKYRWGGLADPVNASIDVQIKFLEDGGFVLIRNFAGIAIVALDSQNYQISSKGSWDFYLARFTSLGDLRWYKTIGGLGFESVTSVYTNKAGDVYLYGGFQDTVDFDPGAGVFNMVAENQQSNFLLKLTPAFPTGISMATQESEPFHIYPNPTSNNLTIGFNQSVSNASLSLTDLQGRVVQSAKGVNGGNHTIHIDGLAAGMYLLQVQWNGQTATRKVVKCE